jgi:HPt (histidine-containing phosphotransfer) domain-containing protein
LDDTSVEAPNAQQWPPAAEQRTAPAYDDSVLISSLADDPELVQVLDIFIETLPEMLDSIRAAWRQINMKTLKRHIHELKGAGGSAGFPIVMQHVAHVENTVATGQADQLAQTVEELLGLCEQIMDKRKATADR